MARALRILALAGVVVAVPLVVLAAVGLLYVLRGALGVWAPTVRDALPLDELPGHADVSLLQFLAVWLSAGLLLGLLARAARVDRLVAALLFASITAAMLLVATWLSIYVVRQIPSAAAFDAAWHVRSIYLAAILAGAGGALLGRRQRGAVSSPGSRENITRSTRRPFISVQERKSPSR